MGVIVGVAVIVTMVSFGLGLQSNMLARFKALDLFNEILVFGRGLSNLAGLDRPARARDEGERRDRRSALNRTATRILDDAGVKEIASHPRRRLCRAKRQLPRLRAFERQTAHAICRRRKHSQRCNSISTFRCRKNDLQLQPRMKRLFPNALSVTSVSRNPLTQSARPSSYSPLLMKSSEERRQEEEDAPNFFGIPLDDSGFDESGAGLQTRTFQIVGVLSEIKEGAGQGGMRGMTQRPASTFLCRWRTRGPLEHRGPMSRVALALARQGGNLAAGTD